MTDSKIDEYIKRRSENDPDFANAVKKDKETLNKNMHPLKTQYKAL